MRACFMHAPSCGIQALLVCNVPPCWLLLLLIRMQGHAVNHVRETCTRQDC